MGLVLFNFSAERIVHSENFVHSFNKSSEKSKRKGEGSRFKFKFLFLYFFTGKK